MKHIYVDESRISQGRYLLFGSLWLDRAIEAEFEERFWQLWDASFPSRNSELKWSKVSRKKLPEYQGFIDFFLASAGVDFRCVVLDRHSIDYQSYHDGDEELGFYKFLFFFLSRNIDKDYRYQAIRDVYRVFIDSRRRDDETGRLTDLKQVMNNWLDDHCVDTEQPVVRNVESVPDSKESPQIQIVDLLTGAVGYAWEGYQTSEPKLALIQDIESKFGLKLSEKTPYLSERLNIWEFRLQKTESALRPTPPKGLNAH